jgi:cytochrome d ubiquinol oxidase subunit I
LNTAKHQPAKLAAMEGHWDGTKPAGLVLFAWPDTKTESNLAEVAIPGLGSLLITHNIKGLFPGLKEFKPEDRPPVVPVFFMFRLMVGIGMVLIAIGLTGAFLWWRKRLFEAHWFLKPVRFVWPLGFIAILAGWMVTEIGRQPWIAYGILRTADARSPIDASTVALSLGLFVLVYSVVFPIGVFYIRRMIGKGLPVAPMPEPEAGMPNRPLSAAQKATKGAI